MATLRITQFSDAQPDHYRAEVALEGDGARQTATVQFQFKLTPQEQENIRWYLEDYLQYLSDPAPQIAAKVEKRMAAIGIELFKAIFQANDDARDLWATLRQDLNNTRVEILTDVAQATTIPWELLRDPKTDTCLSLRSPAFVRSYSQAAQRPRLPQADGDAIRILLVICRPRGRADVPFRSVASRLIKGLGNKPDGFQLDVLRPPTFEQLSRVLRQAKAQGKPYHVVHFDGHGVYQDGSQLMLSGNPLVFVDRRPGMHGYLAFENGLAADNVEFVSGSDLGRLLVETDVPVLVLNACRSAHAETQDTPTQVNDTAPEQLDDPHSQVRAFGSLAQEVMDAGVAGVVAMRYNVYVITAAQFVANLYASLVQGQTLGEAVTSGRKQLKDQPQREVAYKPVTLQDWVVPVVYEADAIALFPTPTNTPTLTITLHENDGLPTTGLLDAQLPKTPDVGFFGRDETLLAIDRAFDHHAIVLLHAFAGSGKTSAAAEFGRWYALTGGLLETGRQGYVLFTSFQRYLPLPRVLDKLGQVFERDLERQGTHWLALNDNQRRVVALQVLSQVPVLWIWDNVEPVAGFPDGETERWSEAEQQELADFLRDARDTKAKFLLTSRRDERGWLGDLPVRVRVPPMPMQERVQFARELAKKHGYCLTDIGNWFPLLKYTQGNPLTITVVIGQALGNGYKSKEQIEKFVSDLQSGETELEDDESEGRALSLGASLSYGFKHLFSETERQQLALLYLFQGYVQVVSLWWMGKFDEDWSVPTLRGQTYEQWEQSREQLSALLDRAAELGLLVRLNGNLYNIHPALPWYFRQLFEQYYSKGQHSPILAFVQSMHELGSTYQREEQTGSWDHSLILFTLTTEEANLLYAKQLAQANRWLDSVICIMQGLGVLYENAGRRAKWARLVSEAIPDFVDPVTDGPLPGQEDNWGFINDYRVRIAIENRQWEKAERLQRIKVNWSRNNATSALIKQDSALDDDQRLDIRMLAVDLQQLARIFIEQHKLDGVALLEEDYELSLRINDRLGASVTALNLGEVYAKFSEIRNLQQAEKWYQRGLELCDESNYMQRGKCLLRLGELALERFIDAKDSGQLDKDLLHYLNSALQFSDQGLRLFPEDAVNDLGKAQAQIGSIYREGGDLNRALIHYQDAIRYSEAGEDFYSAAFARYEVAFALLRTGRPDDALLYAQAALRSLEIYDDRKKIRAVQRMISVIKILSLIQANQLDAALLQAQTALRNFQADGDEALVHIQIVQDFITQASNL